MIYFLYFLRGQYQGKRYGLQKSRVTLGRMHDNNIAFPIFEVAVSRYHAVLFFERGKCFISDLGSKNGTFINGSRLPPQSKCQLILRDHVQIGSHVFQLMASGNSLSNSANKGDNGWFDKISQGLTAGFNKLETSFKQASSSSSPPSQKLHEPPSTEKRINNPLSVDMKDDTKLKLLEKIASGGMSSIYKATFTDTQEIVAVKFPKPELASEPKSLQLFKEEIKMSLKFKHINVVHTLMAISYNDMPTMVMEYFPSNPLTKLIPNLSIAHNIHILHQVITGLESIHAKSIIHNDIKPGNIIVGQNYQTKICDFGTAGLIKQINKSRREWDLIGTLLYMSPEQLTPGAFLGPASDIYALSLVMYETLTKKHPFRDSSNTENVIKEKQLKLMPLNPCEINPEIPIVLDQLIMKNLQKDPKKRNQSIREFKIVFENCL